MGICTAVAGFIAVNKAGRHDSVNLLKLIMMDAILAVAIGGNSLGGGKFSITGSIIGAYTIEMLNRTLLRLEIDPAMIKVFKAVFHYYSYGGCLSGGQGFHEQESGQVPLLETFFKPAKGTCLHHKYCQEAGGIGWHL